MKAAQKNIDRAYRLFSNATNWCLAGCHCREGACSFRRRSRSGTRLDCLVIDGICNISPGLFDLGCNKCRFADGWSKPHPYSSAQIISNLPTYPKFTAKRYGSGCPEKRSKVKHDQWQRILPCLVLLDGANTLKENDQKTLWFMNRKGGNTP